MKRSPAILTLAAAGLLAGCVTEQVTPSRGMRVSPTSTTQAPARPLPTRPAGPGPAPAPYVLPEGPVATPALTGRSTLSRVEVGVVPLGYITYDGQTLPLTSPDGRFIAVQEGEAPTWEVMLAEPGAEPPARTGLAVYQIGEDRSLTRVEPISPLPPGLVLGRAADDRGFLVEAPQANGSRWIGRVSWFGELEWLVRSSAVCAHAMLTPRGELIYTRRAVEGDAFDLVLLSNGQESVRPADGGSYMYPMCTADAGLAYVLRLSDEGIGLEAIRLDRQGVEGPVRLGATIFERRIQPQADRLIAHQMAATVQPPLPARVGAVGGLGGDATLTMFHPRVGRMAAFRLDISTYEPLAVDSISAVVSRDPARPGYYCTSKKELVFVPASQASGGEVLSVRVLSSPYIPRPITGSPESMILLGPVKGRPDALELVRLIVGPGAVPPSQD